MRIAQVAPLTEAVPPRLYGGTERVVYWLTEELVALAENLDDPVIAARASWVRFRALAESGDLEQADRHL